MAETTKPNYDWGDKKINKWYNRNIERMKPNTIDAPQMELPEQTRESIQDQIRGYLNPALQKALKGLANQRDYERRYVDLDTTSRGVNPNADWYRSAKRNLDIGETFARSAVGNNYRSNVAKATADQFNRYLDRRADYDVANASALLDTDMYDSKVRDAFEQMIYERSVRRARGGF